MKSMSGKARSASTAGHVGQANLDFYRKPGTAKHRRHRSHSHASKSSAGGGEIGGGDCSAAAVTAADAGAGAETGAVLSKQPQPPCQSAHDPWAMHTDPTSGYPYYIHEVTGESAWERPATSTSPAAGDTTEERHDPAHARKTGWTHNEVGGADRHCAAAAAAAAAAVATAELADSARCAELERECAALRQRVAELEAQLVAKGGLQEGGQQAVEQQADVEPPLPNPLLGAVLRGAAEPSISHVLGQPKTAEQQPKEAGGKKREAAAPEQHSAGKLTPKEEKEREFDNALKPVLRKWVAAPPSSSPEISALKEQLLDIEKRLAIAGERVAARAECAQVAASVVSLVLDTCKPFTSPEEVKHLLTIVSEGNTLYFGIYHGVLDMVRSNDSYEGFCALLDATKLARARFPQRDRNLMTIYDTARETVPVFGAVVAGVVCRAEAEHSATGLLLTAPLKHLFRILQKHATRIDGGAPTECETACDIVRGSIVCDSMADLLAMLRVLHALQAEGKISIVRVKNRFEHPTTAGWADAMVNFVCLANGDGTTTSSAVAGHVCELQMIHATMLKARKEFGGHSAYAAFREAAELLECAVAGVLVRQAQAACTLLEPAVVAAERAQVISAFTITTGNKESAEQAAAAATMKVGASTVALGSLLAACNALPDESATRKQAMACLHQLRSKSSAASERLAHSQLLLALSDARCAVEAAVAVSGNAWGGGVVTEAEARDDGHLHTCRSRSESVEARNAAVVEVALTSQSACVAMESAGAAVLKKPKIFEGKMKREARKRSEARAVSATAHYHAIVQEVGAAAAVALGKLQQAMQDIPKKDVVKAEIELAALREKVATARPALRVGRDMESKDRALNTKKDLEGVTRLLADGADPNWQDQAGWAALLKAARRGRTEVAKALISAGADLELRAKDGWTALSLASANGHCGVLKVLIGNGADVGAKDKDGMTATFYATYKNHTKCAQLLQAANAAAGGQTDKDSELASQLCQ
jgi:hypothetical protein